MSYETIMVITNVMLIVLLGVCSVALTILGIKELFR